MFHDFLQVDGVGNALMRNVNVSGGSKSKRDFQLSCSTGELKSIMKTIVQRFVL